MEECCLQASSPVHVPLLFLDSPGPPPPRNGTTSGWLGCSTRISNQENAPKDMPTGHLMEAILQRKFTLLRVSS